MAILTFIIILSILVLVHELGHFLVAKKFKIKVEEFGFGYPPRLFGVKRKGTIYSLNWLPFGGFVRMRGEDLPEGKGSFSVQPKLVKLAVLTAGVAMNFLLGVVLFGVIYTKLGIPQKVDYLRITAVSQNSPAERAGIKPGDKIINFKDEQEFIKFINLNRGKEIVLRLENREVSVIPRLIEATPAGEGALGIGFTNMDMVQFPFWQRPFLGAWVGFKEALGWGKDIIMSLTKTAVGLSKGQAPQEVAGPVGIYQISRDVTKIGLIPSLQFMAILSINLSILNLLPLPALDGGRLAFLVLEAATRRKIKPKIEQMIHLVGMALLIGLMILVTIKDIKRLF